MKPILGTDHARGKDGSNFLANNFFKYFNFYF